jgi:hypothetical protein
MSGKLAICLALAGLAVVQPATADAATLKRSLPCSAIYFIFGGPIGGTTNSSSVSMRNSGSTAIPAGTVYTYTIPAGTFQRQNPSALAPGQVFSVQDARVTRTGSCTASVPGIPVKQLNLQFNDMLAIDPG